MVALLSAQHKALLTSSIVKMMNIGFHKVMSGDNGIALISVGWQNYIDLFYTEVDFLENVASSLGNMFLNEIGRASCRERV